MLKSRKLQRLVKLIEYREYARERRNEQNKKKRKSPRYRTRYSAEERGFVLKKFDKLSDDMFKRMFRMSRESFYKLHDVIEDLIEVDEVKAKCSTGASISTVVKLAITLRHLAGGSWIDIVFAWDISKTTFYETISLVVDAIDRKLKIGFPADNSDGKQSELHQGFKDHSNHHMEGCVMAIDGLLVRTRKPFQSEVKNPMAYYNRKGSYGILVMAGCDVKGKFLMAVANNTAGTHDSLAFDVSGFNLFLEQVKSMHIHRHMHICLYILCPYAYIRDDWTTSTLSLATRRSVVEIRC